MFGELSSNHRHRRLSVRQRRERDEHDRMFNRLIIGSLLLVIAVLAVLYVVEKRYEQIDRENQEQIRWNCFNQASLDNCHPVAWT